MKKDREKEILKDWYSDTKARQKHYTKRKLRPILPVNNDVKSSAKYYNLNWQHT
jgi:hypothetical protein